MIERGNRLYFYRAVAGPEVGPITFEQIGRLITDRAITVITQMRESGCLIWRYANDFPELAGFFLPRAQQAGDPLSKPLASLTPRDLLALVKPSEHTITNWVFFISYVPVTIVVVRLLAFLVVTCKANPLAIELVRHGLPAYSGTVVTLALITAAVGPLAAWFCYQKRILTWNRFLVKEFCVYLVCWITAEIWGMAAYYKGMKAMGDISTLLNGLFQ